MAPHVGRSDVGSRAGQISQPASAADLIGATGGQLTLDGQPYRFLGVNAYELATDWGVNAGCGAMLSNRQLQALFSSLPQSSLVRFWAYQGTMAMNVKSHRLDWAPLDRVVDAAVAHGQRLIFVLGGQGSTCDGGHWQDPSWYNGGFAQVFNGPSNGDGEGLDPLSYAQYVRDVVTRYRRSPAVGMWEPISEPEASTCPQRYQPVDCSGHQTCPDEHLAALALRHFFDVVGAEIHRLDPKHLVESGTLGGGQCGTQGADFAYVSASPEIDVLSFHDYYPGPVAFGGDRWNGLRARLAQAKVLDKPIIGGEVGIEAVDAGTIGCPSFAQRVSDIRLKLDATFAAGSSGMLIWNWEPDQTSAVCSFDTYPGDPLLHTLAGDVLDRTSARSR